jgi:hypothetical protein
MKLKISNIITAILFLAIVGLYYIAFHKPSKNSISDLNAYDNSGVTVASVADTLRAQSLRVYDGIKVDKGMSVGADGYISRLFASDSRYPQFASVGDEIIITTTLTDMYFNYRAGTSGYGNLPDKFWFCNGNSANSGAGLVARGYQVIGANGTANNLLTADGGTVAIASLPVGVKSVEGSKTTFTPNTSGTVILQKMPIIGNVITKNNNLTSLTVTNLHCIRTLDSVTLFGRITFTPSIAMTANTAYTFFNIAAGYRPTVSIFSTALITSSTITNQTTAVVYHVTDGDLSFYPSSTLSAGTSYYAMFSITYITSNDMP